MADDYSNNTATTGRVAIGGTTNGTIEVANDIDWLKVSLIAGRNYEFDVSKGLGFSSGAGLVIGLIDSSGVAVAGSSFSTALSYVPTASADYYVTIKAFNAGTGGYVVSSSAPDDYPGDFSTTGKLQPGTTSGTLEGSNDVDDFAVALTAGLNYEFDVTPVVSFATNGGNPPAETLYGSNGLVVAGGTTTTRTISIQPTVSGTYYLSILSPGGHGTGGYVLTESSVDDIPGDFSTTVVLSTGGSVTGFLESAGDHDYVKVSLAAGTAYQFNVAASASFSGTAPGETLINGTTGVKIAGSATTRQLTYTPTVSGTYYLDVSGSGIGSYGLTSLNTAGSTGGMGTTGGSTTASQSVPVFRFFDSNTGTQFLTSSTSERDTVLNTRPDLVSEGVGLNAAPSTDPNASAVYRFFDTRYGTHFFTSSSSERDTIQATRADLSYEGIGFYEDATPQANTSPVYRFFDSNRGTHFFTGSASERATILSTRADLVPEGISFYSPNS